MLSTNTLWRWLSLLSVKNVSLNISLIVCQFIIEMFVAPDGTKKCVKFHNKPSPQESMGGIAPTQ